jgi:type IV pilus assembly protein PilE
METDQPLEATMQVKKNQGFTLIELMMAVAIVGILAAIAYPSYQESVRKGARAEAKSVMFDLSQMEERYFTNNDAYLAVSAPPASPPSGWKNYSGSSLTGRKYDVSVVLTGSGFTISAAPINGFTDSTCRTLTLTSDGVKDSQIGATSPCW